VRDEARPRQTEQRRTARFFVVDLALHASEDVAHEQRACARGDAAADLALEDAADGADAAFERLEQDVAGEAVGRDRVDHAQEQVAALDVADVLERARRLREQRVCFAGERVAFAKGSRGNIDRVLGTKTNDLEALRSELQGEGGWNTAKIATVHGQDAADRLVNAVDQNRAFRDTFNKVAENSMTAQRLSARDAMSPRPASETALINPNTSLVGLGATATKKAVASIVNTLMKRDPTKSYGEVADVLSRQGTARDAAVQSIVDAISRRQGNAATAPVVGDRASLIAAILANSYARSGPNRKPAQ